MKHASETLSKLFELESFDSSSLEAIEVFSELLYDTNKKISLVSRAGDVRAEIERQIVLSIAALPHIPHSPPGRILDIGSGGGFPAIPLAICRPDDSFDLVESVAKKAFFLERTAERLGLDHIRVINRRAEDYLADDFSDSYDAITIKAVGGWKEAFDWGDRALKPGGSLITFKPLANGPENLEHSITPAFKLAGTFHIKNLLPEVTARIMLFRKSD